MLTSPKVGAVIFAKNVHRVAKFYEQILAMAVKQAELEKIILESAEIILVIHGIPESIASTIVITDPPELRQETPIKLFFPVPNIAEARIQAPILGGCVHPASTEWTAGNFRACDGFDPEGNVIQFRENVT